VVPPMLSGSPMAATGALKSQLQKKTREGHI